MRKVYEKLLFDVDDTLIDNKQNIEIAYQAVVKYLNQEEKINRFEEFYQFDKKYWEQWQEGNILVPETIEQNIPKKVEWLRFRRFMTFFGIDDENLAKQLNRIYIENLGKKVVPIRGAYETLKELYTCYDIIAITNGPLLPLKEKLKKANLLPFIEDGFSAEEIGISKPNKEFYTELMRKIKHVDRNTLLLIGDNLQTDILGGNRVEIDTCWFNREKKENHTQIKPTMMIEELEDLLKLL